jgi:hypothetical protein
VKGRPASEVLSTPKPKPSRKPGMADRKDQIRFPVCLLR